MRKITNEFFTIKHELWFRILDKDPESWSVPKIFKNLPEH